MQLVVSQFAATFMSVLNFVCVASTVVPSLINGQDEQLRHFFMPFNSLPGLTLGTGILALTSFCLMFGGFL